MFSILWTLLLPFAQGRSTLRRILRELSGHRAGRRSPVTIRRTLMSARDHAGAVNVLHCVSPLLKDTQHTILIQNLAPGGEVRYLAQSKPRALTLKLNAELKLDYFEVAGSKVVGGESILICECLSSRPTSRWGLTEKQSLIHPGAHIPGMRHFNPQSSQGCL